MHPFAQNPVSRAVWPWNQPPEPPRSDAPNPRHLFAQAMAGYLLAAFVAWLLRTLWLLEKLGFSHWKAVGFAAAGFTTLMLMLGFASPGIHRRILGALLRLVFWVGNALTAVLLPAVYFLVLLPIALFRRLGGSDSLDRGFPGPAGSLWKPRKPVKSPDEYTRQI